MEVPDEGSNSSVVAALTLFSGLHVAFRMRETHGVAKRKPESIPSPVAHP